MASALLAVLLPGLTGCSDAATPESASPRVPGPSVLAAADLSPGASRACARVLADLDGPVADLPAAPVPGSLPRSASWGDPALTLTCGVAEPPGLSPVSSCDVIRGVSWFVPPYQVEDQSAEVTAVTVATRPRLLLRVPATYRPDGVAAALADVSVAARRELRTVRGCE